MRHLQFVGDDTDKKKPSRPTDKPVPEPKPFPRPEPFPGDPDRKVDMPPFPRRPPRDPSEIRKGLPAGSRRVGGTRM